MHNDFIFDLKVFLIRPQKLSGKVAGQGSECSALQASFQWWGVEWRETLLLRPPPGAAARNLPLNREFSSSTTPWRTRCRIQGRASTPRVALDTTTSPSSVLRYPLLFPSFCKTPNPSEVKKYKNLKIKSLLMQK